VHQDQSDEADEGYGCGRNRMGDSFAPARGYALADLKPVRDLYAWWPGMVAQIAAAVLTAG
jgi:hypothetical protein